MKDLLGSVYQLSCAVLWDTVVMTLDINFTISVAEAFLE